MPVFVRELCNGSTTDFDSVSLGSIPSSRAMLFLCVLSARSDGPLWKWEAAGSNPATQTIFSVTLDDLAGVQTRESKVQFLQALPFLQTSTPVEGKTLSGSNLSAQKVVWVRGP